MDFGLGSSGFSSRLNVGNMGMEDRSMSYGGGSGIMENSRRLPPAHPLSPNALGVLSPAHHFKQCRSIDDLDADESALKLARRDSTALDMSLLGHDPASLQELRLMHGGDLSMPSPASYYASEMRHLPYQHDYYQYKQAGLPLSLGRESLYHMGMHNAAAALRNPFTPSQWAELEHQALIFKCMMARAAIPPELIIPIRRSVAAMSGLPIASHNLTNMGWGIFQLGVPTNIDPEPGRCRRTDGKKWRCSKPVVPEQKYCERHIHRGRNRKKAAESRGNGASQPESGSATASLHSDYSSGSQTGSGTRSLPVSNAASGGGGGGGGGGLGFNNQFQKDNRFNQVTWNSSESSKLPPTAQSMNPLVYDSSRDKSAQEFGGIADPSRHSNMMEQHEQSQLRNSGALELMSMERKPETQALRHFFDDWPRSRDTSNFSWPENEEDKSRSNTNNSSSIQLSISRSCAGNSSELATASPVRNPTLFSALKGGKSKEDMADPIQIGLATNNSNNNNNNNNKNSNGSRPSWFTAGSDAGAAAAGGPLAEVLHSSTPHHVSKAAGLNLLGDGWGNSPQCSSQLASPRGVLQRTAFGCFSDSSSSTSSPGSVRTETLLTESLQSPIPVNGSSINLGTSH